VYKARVTIKGLLDSETRPVATITVPKLVHDSVFPGEQLVRDRIQALLEFHLPEVEIEGNRRFFEKKLAIRNRTSEPVTVWLQRRTRVKIGKQPGWQWLPGAPASTDSTRITVGPGERKFLGENLTISLPSISVSNGIPKVESKERSVTVPFTASRVRMWAESKSGERWTEHAQRDLWLVKPNAEMEGKRGYRAEKIMAFTYSLNPQSGRRIFNERLVQLTNKTNEPLTVELSYEGSRGTQTRWWRIAPLQLEPGQTVSPRNPQGLRIRASKLQFIARGENQLYESYRDKPLHTVREVDGRRVYHANKIGLFEHAFDLANSAKDDK
jgi:hypothetical protein